LKISSELEFQREGLEQAAVQREKPDAGFSAARPENLS
jgi:hypothetical protein